MRVLVVEDDRRIADDIVRSLAAAGYVVERCRDGKEAWFLGDTESYAAIVLDLGLPGMDGLSVLKRWRAAGSTTPVLVLSARGTWMERVEGIDAGADDYLPKPFHMEELVSRLRAVIRRSGGHADSRLEAGPLTLDERQMKAALNGVPLMLSPLEYRLLSCLMHNRGRVLSIAELAEHLHGSDTAQESNAVEVLVGRLRRKLGVPLIETRRGFGYVIA